VGALLTADGDDPHPINSVDATAATIARQKFFMIKADNEKVEQLAANNLTIPQDAIASLLQRLVLPS
jgi:hypothetical protein